MQRAAGIDPRSDLESEARLRLSLPPGHRREDVHPGSYVRTSSHEHDHHRLHDDLLQVSERSFQGKVPDACLTPWSATKTTVIILGLQEKKKKNKKTKNSGLDFVANESVLLTSKSSSLGV